jgi:hypothetical protein
LTNSHLWGKIEEMAQSDIEKAVAEFTAKLKPIEPGSVTEAGSIKAEAPPPGQPAPPAAGGEPCINKGFKDLVGALDGPYIGTDIKDLVTTFLDELPACPS